MKLGDNQMIVLSEKLALVLNDYNELPEKIQKNIDFGNQEKDFSQMKGVIKLLKVDDQYLYIDPKRFSTSLLVSIYGTRIDRTNEDSFDTLLHDFFTWVYYANRVSYTKELITEYIEGLECYAVDNSVENLWHILNLAKQCIKDSNYPNFSSLLSFYSLIELLVLNDIELKDRQKAKVSIVKECGNKLSYFYKNIRPLNFPEKSYINNNFSETQIFENLTQLRHKVIHGVFDEARNKLEELFPIKTSAGIYMGTTEDAESSAFQDQISNLNGLIRNTLGQILLELMKDPRQLSVIKNDINFKI